jgi:hypothetical protein
MVIRGEPDRAHQPGLRAASRNQLLPGGNARIFKRYRSQTLGVTDVWNAEK